MKRKTDKEFKEEVLKLYGNEYVVEGEYINADTPINIRHTKCNTVRTVLPHRILKGDRCLICHGNKRRTIDEFKHNIKDRDDIECIDTEYVNNKTKLLFRCNICRKTFYATPCNILTNNTGCPSCTKSKAEKIIENILSKNEIEYTTQKTFKDLFYRSKRNKLKFDFEISINTLKFLLEFDGEQHFHKTRKFSYEDVEDIHQRDILKNSYCIKNNITLVRIPYTEYKKLKNIINQIISSTTIPDEFKVVGPSGSKSSASLYDNYLYKDDDIV